MATYFYSKPTVTYAKGTALEQKITFWKTFLSAHPTYFAGWIELAKLSLKSGDTKTADASYVNAARINPNSEEITNLAKELENHP